MFQEVFDEFAVLALLNAASTVADFPIRLNHCRGGSEQFALYPGQPANRFRTDAIADLDALCQNACIRARDIKQNAIDGIFDFRFPMCRGRPALERGLEARDTVGNRQSKIENPVKFLIRNNIDAVYAEPSGIFFDHFEPPIVDVGCDNFCRITGYFG